MVYIFDYREKNGTFLPFRVPVFIAMIICRVRPTLDYYWTPEGM